MEPAIPSSKSSSASGGRVKVVVRVRPIIREELELQSNAKTVVARPSEDRKRITLSRPGVPDREFCFDLVASSEATTQESFYLTVGRPLVRDLFAGYNTTVIAYGQVDSQAAKTP